MFKPMYPRLGFLLCYNISQKILPLSRKPGDVALQGEVYILWVASAAGGPVRSFKMAAILAAVHISILPNIRNCQKTAEIENILMLDMYNMTQSNTLLLIASTFAAFFTHLVKNTHFLLQKIA